MDAHTRNRRVAAFEAAARREAAPGSLPVQPAGAAPGQIIHLAYCKTAAGAGTTLVAYLDTNSTGREITVYFAIYGPQATHNLNASSLKNLAVGTEIQVIFIKGLWRLVGCAFDAGPCPEPE